MDSNFKLLSKFFEKYKMLRYKYSTFAKVWIKYCSNIVHIHVNGTVCIILCELPFIEWHAKFTLIPFKPLFD